MTEFEQKLIRAVAKSIKDDNDDLKALTDKVMEQVRAYCAKHKKGYNALNDFQRERLNNTDFILSHVTRFKYTEKQLNSAIENNLKRIPGNLADEDRREELYNVLANLNFKCIYSDTLLIGGGQKIHLDHIIPVNLGGPTDDWNILPICGSCNSSKSDSHLLDWWEKEHTPQDEHKLVYIFEYMANRLLKSLNTKGVKVVTTLTDEQIRKAIELENKERQQEESKQQTIDLEEDDIEEDYEDIEEVEEIKDEKIKRLDAITFLYQMLNHIKQNKQYIISPDNLNQGILDTPSEKDKQRLIDKKFKKLEKLFNSIYKQNKRLTGAKTDIQLLDEQRKMVEYIKSLDIVSYYHISYTYFDELQQMLNDGKTDNEIQQFCNSVDRSFNVDLFIQELQDFMATHDGRYPKNNSQNPNELRLAKLIQNIRQAYKKIQNKEKPHMRLSGDAIDKLKDINFIWVANRKGVERESSEDWFMIFYDNLKKFLKDNNGRYPSGDSKNAYEKKLGDQVQKIRRTYKGKQGGVKLKGWMIQKLDEIDFIWEVDWFPEFYENLKLYIKDHDGKYPSKGSENKEHRKIAEQISDIRQAYNGNGETKLTQERIDKLDNLGFIWDWFADFCEDLKLFIEEHNGKYPTQHSKDKDEVKLAKTVGRIRAAYNNGDQTITLNDERMEMLKAINFQWKAKIGRRAKQSINEQRISA